MYFVAYGFEDLCIVVSRRASGSAGCARYADDGSRAVRF